MAVDGHGTLLVYTSSAGASALEGNLISVDGPSMSRDSIDASHMSSTTWMSFIPADLTDPGTLSCELEFDSSQALPPINDSLSTVATNSIVTINFDGSGTWVAKAIMTEWSTGAAIGERMTANATFKLSGAVSVTTA